MATPKKEERKRLLQRITRLLELPMAILSLVFFILIVLDLVSPERGIHRPWIDDGLLLIWLLFGVEFLLKLVIAPDRIRFLRKNWLDLVVLLVPVLRLFRILLLLRGLSFFRLAIGVRRGARGIWRFFRVSRFLYVLGLTLILDLAAAVAILRLERGAPQGQIQTFGDALYWSSALVTTVSSDLFPVTPWGRVLAVFMMAYGMAIFGYFVGQAANFLQSGK